MIVRICLLSLMFITIPRTGRFGPAVAFTFLLFLMAHVTATAAVGQVEIKSNSPAKRERKPSPPLSSLPTPLASGPLKILLVDDDRSDNNTAGRQAGPLSAPDKIFRRLAAEAVGGDAGQWSVAISETYKDGPDLARLRDFNVVLWYNGGSYGGNPDNSAVLSRADELTARRYLEETGGTFILVSPGFVANFAYGNTWTEAPVPFLTEVLGINGFSGLAERFKPGVVTAFDGSTYNVRMPGASEVQFSGVNPDGAAVVFTATVDPRKTAEGSVAVAVAHPYGRGRFVYVGFTLENVLEPELTPAFRRILEAAGRPAGRATPVVAGGTPVAPTVAPAVVSTSKIAPARPVVTSSPPPLKSGTAAVKTPPPEPPVANLPPRTLPTMPDPGTPTVEVGGTPIRTIVSWTLPSAAVTNASLSGPGQTARIASAAKPTGPTVTVERQAERSTNLGGFYWQGMVVQPGASQVVDNAAMPGSTQRYRVTVTNASGASGSKEAEYKVPPIDPTSLTANQESGGTVVLSWPAVAGVTRYRVQTHAPRNQVAAYRVPPYPPTDVIGATQWRSTPLDGKWRMWSVTSLYPTEGGEYASVSPLNTWPVATTELNTEYVMTKATFWISTGDDNKEALSNFEIRIYINGGGINTGPNNLQLYGVIPSSKGEELRIKTHKILTKTWNPEGQWAPTVGELENIKRYGLRVVIKYFPNFILDAWKVDKVDFMVSFQKLNQIAAGIYSERMKDLTILNRDVRKRLTEGDNQIELIIDGSKITLP